MLTCLSHIHLRGLKDNTHKLERTTHIVGNNGSGKTTLLEAASLLLNGKSFLSVNKQELISANKETMLIGGAVKGDNNTNKKLIFSLEKTKANHKADEKKLSQKKAHLEHPLCVIDSNVVNVSSGQAFFQMPTWGAYTATKLAVAAMSNILHYAQVMLGLNLKIVSLNIPNM